MNKRSMRWSLVAASAVCLGLSAMPGCELLVDFDRSKIPQEGGLEDVTVLDSPSNGDVMTTGDSPTGTEGGAEASAGEGGADSGADAPHEGSTGADTGTDAPAETGGGKDSGGADSAADDGSTDAATSDDGSGDGSDGATTD